MRSDDSGPTASKRCLPTNSATAAAKATSTKALITALPMIMSGCRALAERRAGKSTLSGSMAARGHRGTRLASPRPKLPAAALLGFAAERDNELLAGLAPISAGLERKDGPARCSPFGGVLTPVTATHPILRLAWSNLR